MKQIDVKEQPILSFGRTLKIALIGVRYRLFRALVTVAVIAVAMSFLMNILGESLIKRAVGQASRREIEDLRSTDKWIARLSVPQTREEILARLAGAEAEPNAVQELSVMSGLPPEAVKALVPLAQQARQYLDFFNRIDYGRRRILVGSAAAAAIFDVLQDEAARQRFLASLATMKTVRFESAPEAFTEFLGRWPELNHFAQATRRGQQAAIDVIQQQLKDRPLLEAIERADADFGIEIRKAGFVLEQLEAKSLSAQARRVIQSQVIGDTINQPKIRQAIAARKNVLPGDVTPDMIWRMLRDRATAAWYLETMQANRLPLLGLDAAQLQDLAQARAKATLLVRAERATLGTGGGFMGIGQRMTWLAFVSMLLCVVGIANAMLMAVTERFREIATLKCLGALDGFIMTVFLIESSILGLVGGLAGTIAGLLIGILRMQFSFDGLVWQSFPTGAMVTATILSIVIGVVLAAVAAIYPSLRAARLAPMEAMRIE